MPRRVGKVLASVLADAAGATVPAWADGRTEQVSVGPGGARSGVFVRTRRPIREGRTVAGPAAS